MLRVLHVDDNEINMQVMDQILRVLGHEPVGVCSGTDAYDLIETTPFDLVMTDYHMPDVSGLDVLRNIRALRQDWRTTPVVVVTADVMSFSAPQLRAMGFAGALAKPVTVTAVQRILDRVRDDQTEFVGEGFARARA